MHDANAAGDIIHPKHETDESVNLVHFIGIHSTPFRQDFRVVDNAAVC